MEPTESHVMANGLRHRVLTWDGGGRATVLCLHGFLDVAWAFHAVAPRLAGAGFHVVAPDLRGHGRTERVGAGGYYHFADYVLDMADLADALARDRLLLVGHSMGGSVGALMAGTFPDRPDRLAILEGIHLQETAETPPQRMARWIEATRRARTRAPRVFPSLEAAAERLRALDPRCPPEEARFLADRGTSPVSGGLAFQHDPLHATPGPNPFRLQNTLAFYRAVRCPVLLLDAAESETPAPPDLAERAAAFADARREVVEGAGHMMMRHRPEAVARALLGFLGRSA